MRAPVARVARLTAVAAGADATDIEPVVEVLAEVRPSAGLLTMTLGIAWSDTAKEFARDDADVHLLIEIANNRVTAIECPVTADEVIAIGDFLVATGHPRAVRAGLNHLEHGLFWAGHGERLRSVSAAPEAHNADGWSGVATSAVLMLYDGRLTDASRIHRLAAHTPDVELNDVARGCNALIAPMLAWLTGDGWAHAASLVDDARRRYKGALWTLTAAWIRAETGSHDEAARLVANVDRNEIRTFHTFYLGSHGIASLCHTALCLDRPDLTDEVYSLVRSLPEFMCGQNYSPYPAMSYYQGRLAYRLQRHDEAVAHLDRATYTHSQFGAAIFSLLTRIASRHAIRPAAGGDRSKPDPQHATTLARYGLSDRHLHV
jgi:hypothetical protein